MKLKLTLIMAAIFMSGLLVNAANPAFPQGKTPSQKSAPSSLSQANKIHLNGKANRNAIINDASLSKPRRAASTGGNGQIISPSGKPFDYLYSYCLMDGWGDSYIAGKHVNIYYDDSDNSLYLGNFLDEYMGDCYYVGGKLIEGDLQNGVMEFETRKAVYYSYGNWLMLIIASYDEKTGDFYVNDEETTFKLYAKDGVISNYDTFLALASVTNDTDVYWLQSDICYDPIDMSTANTVEIPASATLNHYYQTVNGDSESIASVYRDGDDFYFNNVFEQGFTFLGHLDNNKIKIELPQLVKCDDEFVYVNTYYSVGDDQYKPGSDEAIWFDFDPKTGDISYEGAAITLFSGNKFLYSSAVLNIASLDLVMFTADEEPTEVPASAVQKLYTMSTGYDFQGNHKAGLMKIARDGNTVYFMRVDNNDYNVVMKGELDPATNKVTVPLSQIIGIRESVFLGISLAKQSIVVIEDPYDDDYNEIRYVYDSESPSFITIDYDPDTETYYCHDVLAIINAQKHTVSISLINPTYAPVEDVCQIPEDAEVNNFVFSNDGTVNSSTEVKIYQKDNDFYFLHPSPGSQVEQMTVHGVLNDEGKIEIKVPQLIARGSKDQGVFLRVGDLERVGTPEDEDLQMRFWNQFNDSDVKSICLDYDNGIHEFNYDGSFYFIQFNDARSLVKAQNPYYKPHVVGLFEPAAPTDLALYGKEEDYWGNFKRYRFDFVIPCQSVDGTYLSYDNMFFRIYFDDQVFTFTPEEYPQTFTDEISEVPFNHPASSEIPHPIWDSTMRQVYIYNLPSEKIGVQSCYKYNGQAKYSEISYIAADPSGVVNVNSDIIPSDVQYFDAWGRQTDGSNSGLVIVRKSYPDGRVITEKKINGCSSR